ncbi:MAG: carbohydrate ABC transporter permease [Hyphomicrobiales bacterium]
MKFGTVDISAILIGAVWGAVWMIITGIVLMLVSGLIVSPLVGLAALTGAICGFMFLILQSRFEQPYKAIGALAVFALVVFAMVSLGQPFGADFGQKTLYQMIAFLVWSGLTALSVGMCLTGYRSGSAKRYRMELLLIRFLKGLAFVFFTIIVVLPFYVMLMTSFKSQQSLLANPLDFSIDFGQGFESLFRSYVELFTQYHFGSFLMNTAFVSVCTVIITLAFAIPGAYAVARLRFPGQAFLSRSILLIYMVPAIVLVIPLYAVFSQLGLRNSLTGLLIVYPATTIPVALYMLQGYFRGLPSELEDAGLMDGLSRLGVIAKITMPLSLPALASVALYVFMIAWNEFLFAFMFLDDLDLFTLSRGVVSLNSSEVPRQHLMAGAVIATVPVLAIFLWFERFLVAGLTAGSVKG